MPGPALPAILLMTVPVISVGAGVGVGVGLAVGLAVILERIDESAVGWPAETLMTVPLP